MLIKISAITQNSTSKALQRALEAQPSEKDGRWVMYNDGTSDDGKSTTSPCRTYFQQERRLFKVGDRVERHYCEGRTYYPAWITAGYDDGTYDIIYDLGDTQEQVPVESLCASSTPPPYTPTQDGWHYAIITDAYGVKRQTRFSDKTSADKMWSSCGYNLAHVYFKILLVGNGSCFSHRRIRQGYPGIYGGALAWLSWAS